MRLRPVLSLSLCLGLFAALATGCGGDKKKPGYAVQGTDTATAAQGTITFDRTGENFEVTVNLRHLPPPQRVDNSSHYVMWLKPVGKADARPIRAAVLDFDPSTREGKARATTTYPTVDVLVTAEQTENPSEPSENVVVQRTARLAEAQLIEQ